MTGYRRIDPESALQREVEELRTRTSQMEKTMRYNEY